MRGWWKGVALVAAWLTLVQAGGAQPPYRSTPVGAARMPEPLPCGPGKPQPNMVPGPLSPQLLPLGPPPSLSLPAEHLGAFECEEAPPECAAYGSVGMQWLQRQRLGKGGIAGLDSFNFDVGGNHNFRTAVVAQRYNDLPVDVNTGIRGTVGFLFGGEAIEVTGFYLFQWTKVVDTQNPGRLDAFFFNAPLGFEGNNGLWLQADRVFTRLSTSMGNAEVNYRRWNTGVDGCDLILGIRYVHLKETLRILTDDEGLTFVDINNAPDPTRQADYGVALTNNIVAPQVGFEYASPLILPEHARKYLGWIWFGCSAKAAFGPNLINANLNLRRGDGFSGFNTRYNSVSFGQVYDLGGFIDFHLLERCRLRAGYNAIWLAGIATPNDQIDFDLANPQGRKNDEGSALFHGPMFEVQFLW